MKNFVLKKGEALLVTDRLTRKYFSGVDVAEGVIVIADSVVAFSDARYFYAAKETFGKVGIECKLYTGLESVKAHIEEIDAKELLIDYRTATVREYESYKTFGLEITDGSLLIEKARAIKSEKEINDIRSACKIIEKAYHTAINKVKRGMSEIELKNLIEKYVFEFGGEDLAFETIVAFGEHAAVPHHVTGETLLEDNSVILVDAGCRINGYCSDLTRTAFFGTPDKKFLDCYSAVLNANLIAEENIKSGMTFKQADGFAREYLKDKGLDKYFTHSLGHGLGLEVHEYPTLSPRGEGELQENMAFTVEPGVYFDGEFGIRIEDTVILNGGKVERLFSDDKNLIIL